MPRVGDVFQLLSGTLAVPNTTIQSAPYNAQQNDWVLEANTPRPISAGGTGATTASGARASLGTMGAGDLAASPTKALVVNTDSVVIIDSEAANATKRWLVSDIRVAFGPASHDHVKLVNTTADIGYFLTGTAGAGTWAWNTKADGTGTNIATLTEAGNFQPAGVITGQTIRSSSGNYIGNESSLMILSPTTGDSSSTIHLRPNGVNNASGAATITADGVLHASSLHVSEAGATQGGTGYATRLGTPGGYDGNVFNLHWNGTYLYAYVNSTNLGAIGFVSDYRVKKDVTELPSTWETVKALRPISYTQAAFTAPVQEEANASADADGIKRDARASGPTFVEDDDERWGFLAHELQETLVASAATGVKDMHDGVQSPNAWPVLAALTRALQEAMDRIETQDARIAALEGSSNG